MAMVIDVHAHYYPKDYTDYIGRPDVVSTRVAPLSAQSLHERLELLDEAGIDLQVLSVSQAQPYLPEADRATQAAQMVNDLYIMLCVEHPQRFRTFAALPLPHVAESLQELDRVMTRTEVVGITLGCTVNGRPLDIPAFGPIFEELNRRHAVVFLHPVGRVDIDWLSDFNLAWMVGAPFEDTVAAVRLVLSGTIDRYPDIRFIVPHLGGTLPFLGARIASKNALGTGLTDGLKTLYYDTVSGSVASLVSALDTFGPDRLLLGSDYPYYAKDEFLHLIRYIDQADLSHGQRALIKGGSAGKLLNLA